MIKEAMRRLAVSVAYIGIAVGICLGQAEMTPGNPARIIEITLPPKVASETVVIRYALEGDAFGAMVKSRKGVSSYSINVMRGEHPSRIRGIIYAPGCAVRTFDISPPPSNYEGYRFSCLPLASLRIAGTVARTDRLYGREIIVQAKYVARWAQRFLGVDESLLTSIPVGEPTEPSQDGKFQLVLPDFATDPIAGAPDHDGEIEIWTHDKSTGDLVALLVPTVPASLKVHFGGLKIQRIYPDDVIFTPCASYDGGRAQVHDAMGFARRPGGFDACN
jgi:hypothetical protein